MPEPVSQLAFSLNETAQHLCVSAQTVYKLVKSGELKARRVGTRVLIPRTELERFLSGEK